MDGSDHSNSPKPVHLGQKAGENLVRAEKEVTWKKKIDDEYSASRDAGVEGVKSRAWGDMGLNYNILEELMILNPDHKSKS